MFTINGYFIRSVLYAIAIARNFFVLMLLFLFSFTNSEGGKTSLSDKQPLLSPADAFGVTLTPSNYSGFNISCKGASDGSITTSLTGGVSPFTFLWSNSATTQDLTGIPAGTYTLTVTDNTGDLEVVSITLIEPAPINISVNSTDVTCYGGTNGVGDITVVGGAAPYTYLWNNSATTEDISGVMAGTYLITVTDLNNCPASIGFDITQPDSLFISSVITDVTCNGGADGAINITVSGGTGSYSYLWSNTSTLEDQVNLVANTYTVTVTDANTCTKQQTFLINEPAGITISGIIDSVDCYGDSNGAINITASGGAGALTYLWSNSSTNEDQVNLTADIYTVTVTDTNSCSEQQSFPVFQADSISIAGVVMNVLCNGQSNGSINITITGGTGTMSFLWNNSSNTEDITNLIANTYSVTVTDIHSCTSQKTFIITQPDSLNVTGVISNVNCNGGTTGAINITSTGGTGTLTYLWSNSSTLEDQSNLAANTYTVTVTDANNCTKQKTFAITQPNAIIISETIINVGCNGASTGAINITASGGTGSLTYLWSNSSTIEDQINLIANTYSVTVTDSLGCTAQKSFIVTQATAISINGVADSVSCNGLSDGSINITASGGTGALTYLWSNSSTNEDQTNLPVNSYTVTVTDSLGCTSQQSFIVSQPLSISITGTVTDVSCNGGSNGTISITTSGGTGTLTYLWSNTSIVEDQINLTANTYTVTVSDANNCTAQQSFVVAQPVIIVVTGIVTNVNCNGQNTGAIDITATGGTGTLTYLWSNTSIIEDQTNLIANTYTVTVTDSLGCTKQNTFSVSQPAPILISGNITNINCNGDSTGAINITASGGVIPYTYLWSNTSTNEDQTNLTANTYTVTVTDSLGCTAQQSFIVNQSSPISITGVVINDSCFGSSNGAIDITTIGGLGGFTYLWSNSSTNEDQTNLVANTYTVTATDVAGCSSQEVFTVTQPTPIIINGVVTNVSCNAGTNGGINITASGGTGTLTYLWSNTSSNEDQANLIAASYTVTVTDVNSCTAQQIFVVTQPQPLTATFNSASSTCNQNNGNATVNPSGGNGAYTYLWSNTATTQTISNLAPATYTVTVTDSLFCSNSFSVVINAISGLTVLTNSITNVSCNGGTNGVIDINVSGGTQPYQYLWSNLETTQDISGLTANLYVVTITDSTNCVETDSFTVTEPTAIAASFTVTNAACGQANGSATVISSGGTPSYTYLWSNNITADSIKNVISGTYTVTVTDSQNCISVFNTTIGNDPGPSVVIDSVIDASCAGGSDGAIYITGSGGTPSLQYLWSNTSTTDDITGLQANNYTVTVTDSRGCTATIIASVGAPSPLSLGFTSTNANCNTNNGTVQVNVSGGTVPYQYLWSNNDTTALSQNLFAGIYTVTITDNHGCITSDTVSIANSGVPQISLFNQTNVSCNGGNNGSLTITASNGVAPYSYVWSNGDTSSIADTLSATNYTVTVTDFTGCTQIASYSITQPTQVTLQFAISPEPCNNGNGGATVTANGGTPGYTYLWSTNDTTPSISNVAAGNYTVTVTDQNNCSVTGTANIISIAAPQIAVTSVTNLVCNGIATGAINITVTGGVPTYSYLWSNTQTTEDISNLPAGIYTITVTDVNNCQDTIAIPVTEPSAIVVGYTVTPSTCANSNGSISTTVNGGTGGYNYLWSNAATTSGISNIPAAVYILTVTDANSCQHIDSILVSDIDGPAVTTQSILTVTCNGGNDGGINVNITQGTPPYSFLWSNNSTLQNISGVSAGIYFLTVTDFNGCIIVFSDTIPEPPPIIVSATITNATCNLNNGIITVTPIGGTAAYSYTWSTGAHSSTISSVTAGVPYTITITDANNCVADSSFTLSNSGSPAINVVSITNIRCNGGNEGAIDISVSSGSSPYQFFWSNNTQTEDLQNLIAGTYTVTVTDSMGCTATQLFNIIEPLQIAIAFPLIINANCNQSNGVVAAFVYGGMPGYTFLWSTSSINDTITNLAAGSYTVTVTDIVGCTRTSIANVSNINGPSIVSVSAVNVSCPGGDDGSITITATGGTGALTYSWINNPSTSPTINNLSANTYTVTVRDAANCLAVRSVIITEPPPFLFTSNVPLQNPPYNLSCFQTGDGIINLYVSGGTAPYIYVWSNGSNEDSLQNLSANNYTVVITDANQCTASDTFALTEPPELIANAGTNFTICGESQTTLNATPITIGLGYWQVISGNNSIVFADSTAPTTMVSNLPVGDNIFQWTVTNGDCADSSIIIVTTASSITAIPGIDRVLCGNTTTLDATRPQFGSGFWSLVNGGAVILDSSNALTGVQNLSFGVNVFNWIVSNGSCRDTGTITITRRDSLDCLSTILLPTAFSPNSDGHNDLFEIKGILDYTDNDLLIYNRWGKVVNEFHGYHNQWDGSDNSGNGLADGTYFIILRVKGITDIFKSFVDLRR